MGKKDFLIAMRHWGNAPQYTFKEDNLEIYLEEEFRYLIGVSRIIYRRHPWMSSDSNTKIRNHLSQSSKSSKDIEFVAWEDLFNENAEFPELSSPEAEFWMNNHDLGKFFGFDGSLNTLVKLRCPDVEIIYPNVEIYNKYFEYQKSVNLVAEQINWQKDLNKSTKLLKIKLRKQKILKLKYRTYKFIKRQKMQYSKK